MLVVDDSVNMSRVYAMNPSQGEYFWMHGVIAHWHGHRGDSD